MSSTLQIRSRKAFPTDCERRSMERMNLLYSLKLSNKAASNTNKVKTVIVYLDNADVLFWLQRVDIILELDNNPD